MYAKLKIGKHLFSEFKFNKVLRQGDAVACLLLNVVMESEIRRSTVETWGAMFDKFSQIMVQVDVVVITGSRLQDVKEVFTSLVEKQIRWDQI